MMGESYSVEEVITAVQTLTLKPGDIVALMFGGRLSATAAAHIRADLRSVFPESVKVLILEEGMTLARVTVQEDADGSAR
jgi:hypothetical protein